MMNYFVLFPLVSLQINVVLMTYAYSRNKKSEAVRAYLLFGGALAGWQLIDATIRVAGLTPSEAEWFFRLGTVFWVPAAFLFMHFVYKLMQKPKDAIYYLFLSLTAAFVIAGLSTNGLVVRAKSAYWGMIPEMGTLFLPSVALCSLGPSGYLAGLIMLHLRRTDDPVVRNQLRLLVIGVGLTVLLAFTLGVIFLHLLQWHSVPFTSATTVTIQSVFIFLAIAKYKFLALDISDSVKELFSKLHDGVVIADRRKKIAYMNHAAVEFLGFEIGAKESVRLDELDLHGYSASDDYRDVEFTLEHKDGHRVALGTQTNFNQGGFVWGKLLILKDITERKKVEEEVVKLNAQLESKVVEKMAKLRTVEKTLIETEHKSELAEITTGTLHNVMNILNSVKVTTDLTRRKLSGATIGRLKKANDMLRSKIDHLEDFVVNDPKGKSLMNFYLDLHELLVSHLESSDADLGRVQKMVSSIENIVAAQQGYGGGDSIGQLDLRQIVEDAITLQSGSISAYQLKVITDLGDVPPVYAHKTKLLHILINLIKNAREAMMTVAEDGRELKFTTKTVGDQIQLSVSDNGMGIAEDHLDSVFKRGFTTKDSGHGFGLHSCKLYMNEMGGNMRVVSSGLGCGATFLLEWPIDGVVTSTKTMNTAG